MAKGKEIERKWRLGTTNTAAIDELIGSFGSPTLINQVYLDPSGLGGRPFIQLDLPDGTTWEYAPPDWAGEVLAGGPGAVRVRRKQRNSTAVPSFMLTIKSKGSVERDEHEHDLSQVQAELLIACGILGKPVVKHRFVNPAPGEKPFELDIFSGELDGLILLEKEFVSLAAAKAFVLPDIFDVFDPVDVSEDPDYGNFNLAQNGLPVAA